MQTCTIKSTFAPVSAARPARATRVVAMANMESVKKAAAELQSLCSSGLDVLCNNAGVMALADEATAD